MEFLLLLKGIFYYQNTLLRTVYNYYSKHGFVLTKKMDDHESYRYEPKTRFDKSSTKRERPKSALYLRLKKQSF